jgi:hypothetical protein
MTNAGPSHAIPDAAGQELRASEERYRRLVEAVKDYAIFMLDPEGRVATWNAGAQALKGYTPGEIIDQHFSIFYPATDRAEGKPAHELQIAIDDGRFEDEGWRLRKDGTEFWADVLIRAIRDEAGNLVGFAKVTRDLTERREAAETVIRDTAERKHKLVAEEGARHKSQELEEENRRMQEANRLKSEFLANMSHELRTPLNAIMGFAELMFKGKVGPVSDDHKEYLGDILSSSRHLLKIINDILDLAKVESGKIEFRPEPVDLRKTIAEACDILRGLASTKRIRIETKVDSAIAGAVIDPSKLRQVLYNYLSNALKFTPDGGRVTINVVADEAERFRIEVHDTGIGIHREDLHRLFVEFQQLDAGVAKKYAGTGLGLALTKRIVVAQGGVVGVRSEPGKGSTFWAVLPREAGLHSSEAAEPAASIVPPAIERTALVVDDDWASLRLMSAALKVRGHSAVCFADSADALRAMETITPAVIVLDVNMPGIDGFELLDRFRAIPRLRDVPVVVWTVRDLSEAERARLLRTTQCIVPKGQGDNDEILDAVETYFGGDQTGGASVR